jgi:hypothetical protein
MNSMHTPIPVRQNHLHISLPSTSSYSWSLSTKFPYQNSAGTSFSHACYMPHPSLTCAFWYYLRRSTSYETTHSAILSSLLSRKHVPRQKRQWKLVLNLAYDVRCKNHNPNPATCRAPAQIWPKHSRPTKAFVILALKC